jgi:3D (Asp-Asp-Asp) domain-containing protein
MAGNKLSIVDVQTALTKLGYYDGPINADAMETVFRDDLKVFQRDYGLTSDGWYGPKTEQALLPLAEKLKQAPQELHQARRWTLTSYYIADQRLYRGAKTIPVRDPEGHVLTTVEPAFFSKIALEGTGRLRDGRLLNVATDPSYLPCDPETLDPCFQFAKRNGWIPNKPGYAGILVDKEGTKAVQARCFRFKAVAANGWPTERLGIPLDPWRTLATDTGTLPRHDPGYKGTGGVVPSRTKVFIVEAVGWKLPDGSIHDGWFTANDTGGGIFGPHFDVFVGNPQLAQLNVLPHRAHIWFDGIETKLPMMYNYGSAL